MSDDRALFRPLSYHILWCLFQCGIIIYFKNMEMFNKIRDFDDIRWIFILSYKIKEPPK